MNLHEKRLKQIIHEAAFDAGVSVDRHDAEAVYASLDADDDSGLVAAKAVFDLCIEDGKFNNFTVGLVAAMRFLAETTTQQPVSNADVTDCLNDLRETMHQSCAIEDLAQWASRWYK